MLETYYRQCSANSGISSEYLMDDFLCLFIIMLTEMYRMEMNGGETYHH